LGACARAAALGGAAAGGGAAGRRRRGGGAQAGMIMCENMPGNALENRRPGVLQIFWRIFRLKNQPPAAPRA